MLDKTPVRDAIANITGSIPSGPLGNLGEGNILGFIGFIAVESGEVVTLPIPGLTRPGFRKVSHSMEVLEEGLQEHTIRLHALSEDVAEFVTQYDSAPSNFDFLRGRTEVVEVNELDSDVAFQTYEITVRIDRREVRDELAD